MTYAWFKLAGRLYGILGIGQFNLSPQDRSYLYRYISQPLKSTQSFNPANVREERTAL
jgi:hypothetical protein